MIKADYILNESSSFERAHGVRELTIRLILAIIGLTSIIFGLPLLIITSFL